MWDSMRRERLRRYLHLNIYWLPREDTRFLLRFRVVRVQRRFFLKGKVILLLFRSSRERPEKEGQPNTWLLPWSSMMLWDRSRVERLGKGEILVPWFTGS